jgi:hypothetical protein
MVRMVAGVAVVTGVAPLALAGSGVPALAAVWTVVAAADLTWLANRDLEPEASA